MQAKGLGGGAGHWLLTLGGRRELSAGLYSLPGALGTLADEVHQDTNEPGAVFALAHLQTHQDFIRDLSFFSAWKWILEWRTLVSK